MRMAGSPVRQFDPYTRPRLARWPIPGRLSQCLLLPVHVWLTAKLAMPPMFTVGRGLSVQRARNPVCIFRSGEKHGVRIPNSGSEAGHRTSLLGVLDIQVKRRDLANLLVENN